MVVGNGVGEGERKLRLSSIQGKADSSSDRMGPDEGRCVGVDELRLGVVYNFGIMSTNSVRGRERFQRELNGNVIARCNRAS